MKKLYLILFINLFLLGSIIAQSPEAFKYQAIARSSSREPLVNLKISVRVQIIKGSIFGPSVFVETHQATTNEYGLLNLSIGAGKSELGTFDAIEWGKDQYFIEIAIDAKNGTNYVQMGIAPLLSVPYALYAKTSGNGFSGNYNDLTSKPDFSKWDKDSTDNVTISGNQTIAGNKTFTGTISANNRSITNVANPITNQDAANKAYVDLLLNRIEVLEMASGIQKVFDSDGNSYKIVKIGTQVWMAENLKTTKYNDGTTITLVTDNTAWTTAGAAYCWFNNDANTYKATYGALYNWKAVDPASNGNKNICPTGWHVPGDTEWKTMEMALGMSQAFADLKEWRGTNEGSKLAGNAALWIDGALDANAAFAISGFTALPGGIRAFNGPFFYVGYNGHWWSSTESYALGAWSRSLRYDESFAGRWVDDKSLGFSIRCLRDN